MSQRTERATAGLRIGSLFAGIGGLELGLEWAGVGHTVWQVELDQYCRNVLAKHWPNAERFADVRTVGTHNLSYVDVICGGFPCQPHSHTGKRRGDDDERYLWPEFARIVRELGPRFVVVENVPGVVTDGTLGRVLGDLADIGFDAEWSHLSACAVGATHTRERLFVVAYANSGNGQTRLRSEQWAGALQHGDGPALPRISKEVWLEDPSPLYRTPDGVPSRRERGIALGNSVVPQCAEKVGQRLLQIHAVLVSAHQSAPAPTGRDR